MITYCATLQPKSAVLSPWQADMLFGHLCWLKLYWDGESALKEFIDRYQGNQPPLIFSDAFPATGLPRPLLPRPVQTVSPVKLGQVQAMQEAKESKSVRWVSLQEFNTLRSGSFLTPKPATSPLKTRTLLKNQINRLSGTTAALEEQEPSGNLYPLEELAYVTEKGLQQAGINLNLYIKAQDEAWGDQAKELLTRLAEGGYGAKKSTGYGQFSLIDFKHCSDFNTPVEQPNGFISLSNWTPAQNDPVRGFYSLQVKYGKLGEELANAENPFKFPLIQLKAGSAFYAEVPIREWYGRLIKGISPETGKVVQYGFAFALPAHLEEENND